TAQRYPVPLDACRKPRGLPQPLGDERPGCVAVRQQVAADVEELERRPGGATWRARTERERREELPERLDRGEHQPDADAFESAELLGRLVGVREESREREEHRLVRDVEEVR